MLKLVDIHNDKHSAGQCRPWARLPLSDHMTNLRNFTKGEFSVFPFSRQLMCEETLSNLIVCLMISEKNDITFVQTSQHVALDTV